MFPFIIQCSAHETSGSILRQKSALASKTPQTSSWGVGLAFYVSKTRVETRCFQLSEAMIFVVMQAVLLEHSGIFGDHISYVKRF
jgi:hypothetical protein